MLSPYDRKLLLDLLRPPEGFVFDIAVGTSFSLDLLTLLSVPLAFAFKEWEDEKGTPTSDPVALLRALLAWAARIRIFHQSGQIQVPTRFEPLFYHLEGCLVPVKARSKYGVFHPKLWLLRFTSEVEPTRYRLICPTRNLTFDTSWDTALVMEGELTDRQLPIAANHGLVEFLTDLPTLALKPIDAATTDIMKRLLKEVPYVRFAVPYDFDRYRFWAMGLTDAPVDPFPKQVRRLLVMSPFLSDGALMTLTARASGNSNVLVGRPEELAGLNETTRRDFRDIFALIPRAQVEEAGHDGADASVGGGGLHAKLYVAEAGRQAWVWTGSANATNSALKRNVEFMVELSGRRARVGVDSFLEAGDANASMRHLLQPFVQPDPLPRVSEEEKRLDKLLRDARAKLASHPLLLRVSQQPDRGYNCELILEGSELRIDRTVSVNCWLISKPARRVRLAATSKVLARFGPMLVTNITPFVAFSATAKIRDLHATVEFVLSVPVQGMPKDRNEILLRGILHDRKNLMRFLLMLVTGQPNATNGHKRGKTKGAKTDGSVFKGQELFESMVECLANEPERLRQVARVLEEVGATHAAPDILPEGFREIWDPIWHAYEALHE